MIFFDLDDTLVASEAAHLKAIAATASDDGQPAAAVTLHAARWLEITDHYLGKYFNKEIGLEDQRALRIRDFWALLGQDIELGRSAAIYQRYHANFLKSCARHEDAIRCLESLKGFPMGIITNGVKTDQLFKLENNQLLSYFSSVFISEEVGMAKPAAGIFKLAARKNGLDIGQCMYIGNSFELDYRAACTAGMQGYWLNRGGHTDEHTATFNNLNTFAAHVLASRGQGL